MHNEFSIPHQILEDDEFKRLKISAKFLYCYLAKLKNRYGKDDGWFWRDERTICEDTKMHRNTVSRAKKELKDAGFIEIKRGHYVSTGHRGADYFKINGYIDTIQ